MGRTIAYTIAVTLTQTIEEGDDPADYQTQGIRTSIERGVIRELEHAYGKGRVDAEVERMTLSPE